MAHNSHGFNNSHRQEFGACLREVLPPSFWKRVRAEFDFFNSAQRKWSLPMCWNMGLSMALSGARTQQEAFECARESVTALYAKRKRCGRTLAGYTLAVSRLPLAFFARVRAQLQNKLASENIHAAQVGRWLAFAIDGSKQNIPRTRQHELKYGLSTKGTAQGAGAPQCQVVAAVAMGKNVIWDWQCASALTGEREMALKIMQRLPALALGVLDAGFLGYERARTIQAMNRFFLVRVGANVRLWVEELNKTMAAEWKDGEVWLWPDHKQTQAPLVLRLIKLERRTRCSRGDRRKFKTETIWLVTNVLDGKLLSPEEASVLYEKRWPANECTFRDWKKTLDESKLASRTPQMAECEQEFGLCAMQILQVMTLLARAKRRHRRRECRVSVAQAQRVWRKAARALTAGKSTRWFKVKLATCVGDEYIRKSRKIRREWPERKAHETPKAPKMRRLTKRLKIKGANKLQECVRKAG